MLEQKRILLKRGTAQGYSKVRIFINHWKLDYYNWTKLFDLE